MKEKILLLALIFFIFSCEEEDEFKIPVDVQISMEIIQPNQVDFISFSTVEMVLESFSFAGEREQSEDVEFSKEFEPGLLILANPSTEIEELSMTIPQGIYTSISMSMETAYSEQNFTMIIKGNYKSANENIPVMISFSNEVDFEIGAVSILGNKEIVIKNETTPKAIIKLNPASWFKSVPANLLMKADRVSQNGISMILISEKSNQDIFEIIIDRIEDKTEIIFYN